MESKISKDQFETLLEEQKRNIGQVFMKVASMKL